LLSKEEAIKGWGIIPYFCSIYPSSKERPKGEITHAGGKSGQVDYLLIPFVLFTEMDDFA